MSATEPEFPPDLLEVARNLDAEGPCMTESEFARVRKTALQRADRPRPQFFLKSRLAIASMLAVGMLMSSGGVALGISALSTDLSPRAEQYGGGGGGGGGGGSSSPQRPSQTVAPVTQQPAAAIPPVVQPVAPTIAPPAVVGDVDEDVTPDEIAPAQEAEQLGAAKEAELPFTGYAAVPLLLMGLALLIAGCLMRRAIRESADHA